MTASVRAELLRLGRWPVTWILGGVWLVLNLLFVYVFDYLAYRDANAQSSFAADGLPPEALLARMSPENFAANAVEGLPMFGGAIVMIMAALAVGSGYGWGTWKTVFTVGPRRRTAFLGTLVTLGILVTGMMVVTMLVDAAAAAAIAAAEGQPIIWPSIVDIVGGFGGGLLIAGMWTAGGALLGTLTRGAALSVGLGLIWSLIVENLLRGVASLLGPLEAVTKVLPGTAAGSIAAAVGGTPQSASAGTPGVMSTLDGGTATAVLAAYLLAFLVAATLLTTRRDIT